MEILQHFLFENTAHNVTIAQNADGTPMFRASDIGEILGIKNMSDATSGFPEDQAGVVSNYSSSQHRKTLYLSEKGVYRVLCRSRKAVAWPFQEWVIDVIAQINRTGKYELESAQQEAELYKEKSCTGAT